MTAAKGNKVYTITEAQQADYQAQGFDIYADDGSRVACGKGKTVSFEKYAELETAYKELKEKYAELEVKKSGKKEGA